MGKLGGTVKGGEASQVSVPSNTGNGRGMDDAPLGRADARKAGLGAGYLLQRLAVPGGVHERAAVPDPLVPFPRRAERHLAQELRTGYANTFPPNIFNGLKHDLSPLESFWKNARQLLAEPTPEWYD